jgi:hypothetical protein
MSHHHHNHDDTTLDMGDGQILDLSQHFDPETAQRIKANMERARELAYGGVKTAADHDEYMRLTKEVTDAAINHVRNSGMSQDVKRNLLDHGHALRASLDTLDELGQRVFRHE